jgi:hypothetical protein
MMVHTRADLYDPFTPLRALVSRTLTGAPDVARRQDSIIGEGGSLDRVEREGSDGASACDELRRRVEPP